MPRDRKWLSPGSPNPKSRSKEAQRKYRAKRKAEAYAVLGGPICVRCGFTDPRALQIDHLHDDGYKHRRGGKGVDGYYKHVIEHPELYQVLCANCNWIKKAEHATTTHTE